MTSKRFLLIVVALALLSPIRAYAQPEKSGRSFYGYLAGEYSLLLGDAKDVADDTFGFTAGLNFKPNDWPVGIFSEMAWARHDLDRRVVQAFDASGGFVDLWSWTAGVSWSPKLGGPGGLYTQAGAGLYVFEGNLTDPGVYHGVACDPWLWWCWDYIGVGEVISDSRSETSYGWNLGAGFTYELDTGSQVTVEMRYHSVNTPNRTEYLPITVGFRW